MPFSYRNARYLRISENTVLPLYIYLDERHIDWMTDYTLQRVLEDLRPDIGPKLRAENDTRRKSSAAAKKGEVNVHRGDDYQFAYWFRKNEPHAVLIKNRHMDQAPKEKDVASESTSSKKRKRDAPDDSEAPRRSSRRAKNVAAVNYTEDDEEDQQDSEYEEILEDAPDFAMPVDEEEEEKPKMTMRLAYKGFSIYDRCLCLVIQPWPIVRTSRASVAPQGTFRTPSVAPPNLRDITPAPLRERTPLFLPDLDSRRSVTPAPLPARIAKHIPRVPLFNEDPEQEMIVMDDDEDEDGGMMAMSQALTQFRDERAGSADEDEGEGEAFMGDADERKGDL